jgi:hypothetical protein
VGTEQVQPFPSYIHPTPNNSGNHSPNMERCVVMVHKKLQDVAVGTFSDCKFDWDRQQSIARDYIKSTQSKVYRGFITGTRIATIGIVISCIALTPLIYQAVAATNEVVASPQEIKQHIFIIKDMQRRFDQQLILMSKDPELFQRSVEKAKQRVP